MKWYRYHYSFEIKTEVGKILYFSGTINAPSKSILKERLQNHYGKLRHLEIVNKGEW